MAVGLRICSFIAFINLVICETDVKLILTPYIENGDIKEGQNVAVVPPLIGDIKSYSGYFTVNKKYDSNLFFWYFPTEADPGNSSLVLCLSGGPGASSLPLLLKANGPYFLRDNGELTTNEHSWTKFAHMVYIDQPVEVGFSYTNDSNGYAHDVAMAAEDLYVAIEQFLTLFPNLRQNEFFIAGGSYAGKYIPAIAYKIHIMNKEKMEKINLKGVALGDPLIDPITLVPRIGDYLYQVGLIDKNTLKDYKKLQNDIVNNIKQGDYTLAFNRFTALIMDSNYPYSTFFTNTTGYTNYFNLLYPKTPLINYSVDDFFKNSNSTRKKIHVGNQSYLSFNGQVQKRFVGSLLRSVKPQFEILLDNYRIVIYHGHLDILVPHTSTTALMSTANWSGADEYKNAKRRLWHVGGQLAGYVKSAKSFTEIVILGAGHKADSEKPLISCNLHYNFFNNLPV